MTTQTKSTTKTGGCMVIESLKSEGVTTVFGIIGGAIMPIYDELYKDGSIRHITTAHEQGAVHAADGYARVTGKVGVCLATSGPGATNLVTGLATAYMDSIPMLALTGQVTTGLVGKDAFQEADIRGITAPITKYNRMVTEPHELSFHILRGLYLARSGRQAPVVLDLPKNAQVAQVAGNTKDSSDVRPESYDPTYVGQPKQLENAIKAIENASRPVAVAGGGIIASGASEEIRKFASQTRIPVTCTLMGLGSFPNRDPLFLGMLGMHGTGYANTAVSECDLLICVGTRLDDRITGDVNNFAPNAQVIHIDVDPSEIGKNIVCDIPIVGDAKEVLQALNRRYGRGNQDESKRSLWLKQIEDWKVEYPLTYQMSGELKPQFVIEKLGEIVPEDAIITTGVGQHQMWVAQYYPFNRPRSFVTSGGLGTMGFGFPASLGAQVGKPDHQVICVTGDGSFQMNIQELATAVREKLPITVLVMNNGYLGMVRQWQELFFGGRYAHTRLRESSPNFDRVAQAYGAQGMRVEKPEDLKPALQKALKYRGGPTVIDCQIEEEENVFPMVPAGGSIGDFLMEKEDD